MRHDHFSLRKQWIEEEQKQLLSSVNGLYKVGGRVSYVVFRGHRLAIIGKWCLPLHYDTQEDEVLELVTISKSLDESEPALEVESGQGPNTVILAFEIGERHEEPGWRKLGGVLGFLPQILEVVLFTRQGTRKCNDPDFELLFWQDHSFVSSEILPATFTVIQLEKLKQSVAFVQNDPASYARALKNCKDLAHGRVLHTQILASEHRESVFLGNHLVEMYGECGSVVDARRVFDEIQPPNVHTWTIMLKAYARNGHLAQAKSLFDDMPVRNVVSWTSMLAAYVQGGQIDDARRIFDSIARKNVVTWNVMLSAYAVDGHFCEAKELFDQIKDKNVVTWTIMLSAYIHCQPLGDARIFFGSMPKRNVVSWNSMLSAYARNGDLEELKLLFKEMPHRDDVSWNILLKTYCLRGDLHEARKCFEKMPRRDVVSWTTLLAAYARQGHMLEALEMFEKMPLRDTAAWNCMINLCVENNYLPRARSIFEKMERRDLVSWKTMIGAYTASGNLDQAKDLLDQNPFQDVVSWTSLISAWSQRGDATSAFRIFQGMVMEGVTPNAITFLVVIDACAGSADLARGRVVHQIILEEQPSIVLHDIALGNSLLNLYSKSGSADDAREIFERMKQRDEISWNSMVAAYARSKKPSLALEVFRAMNLEGIAVTEATLIHIMAMSSHAGSLISARDCFVSTSQDFGIDHKLDHYSCMVDHLSRAGKSREAEELLRSMPFEPDLIAWKSLLGAREDNLQRVDSKTSYVLVSNNFYIFT
ncbi:pentatricopeptide repeat-containing protein At2g35030, mitochondrial-like [Selaginella moellendorffii]|uniref:pentatricopeptide repeat-containing protein At2g35030, mitochondrial-like n=1 Tax=Selaginella moellendorffii TaxID=88036 RepID=UPI000D1C9E49|nr:pentatricopeptide repeat-containing protein At2g35030, mitochondrial-like [Selaginella moellendorffii]|eukprot:XP_024538041.1 pentatricopeptide repeat-containing protein At2g35030, mitochondrial-like [Selaginella moellendorffii]